MDRTEGILRLTIVEGRDFAPRDKTGFSDPYCVMIVNGIKQESRTKIINQTNDPKFGEAFNINIKSNQDLKKHGELVVEVWDYDRIGSDEFIGRVIIPMTEISESWKEVWYPLLSKPQFTEPVTGEILLKHKFEWKELSQQNLLSLSGALQRKDAPLPAAKQDVVHPRSTVVTPTEKAATEAVMDLMEGPKSPEQIELILKEKLAKNYFNKAHEMLDKDRVSEAKWYLHVSSELYESEGDVELVAKLKEKIQAKEDKHAAKGSANVERIDEDQSHAKRERELDEREKHIEERKKQVEARERQIEQHAEQDKRIAEEREKKLEERIKQFEEAKHIKPNVVPQEHEKRQHELDERELKLKQREQALSEQPKQHDHQEHEKRRKELDDREAKLKQREHALSEQPKQHDDQQEYEKRKKELDEREAKLKQREQELGASKQQDEVPKEKIQDQHLQGARAAVRQEFRDREQYLSEQTKQLETLLAELAPVPPTTKDKSIANPVDVDTQRRFLRLQRAAKEAQQKLKSDEKKQRERAQWWQKAFIIATACFVILLSLYVIF